MNALHLHLLLNHVPIVGSVIGIGLFLLSLARRSDDLMRASLTTLVLVALATLPVFLTGYAAREAVEGQPGAAADLIQAHLDAAFLGFILMQTTGLVSWIGLWRYRQASRPPRLILSIVLVVAAVMLAVMAGAANVGGRIGHEEIRSDPTVTIPVWITSAAVHDFMNGPWWVWASNETLHFVGLSMLFGVVLVLNLRLLGRLKGVSFAALERLLPWGVLGFSINLITGTLFFMGDPAQYTMNPAFYWKMVFVLPAAGTFLYFTVSEKLALLGPGDDAPPTAKLVAAASLFFWGGVLYFGRMLPYLGDAF